jgi:hypothetical protein
MTYENTKEEASSIIGRVCKVDGDIIYFAFKT